jgi:hypothetical protein
MGDLKDGGVRREDIKSLRNFWASFFGVNAITL